MRKLIKQGRTHAVRSDIARTRNTRHKIQIGQREGTRGPGAIARETRSRGRHRLEVSDGITGFYDGERELRDVPDMLRIVQEMLDDWDPALIFGPEWVEEVHHEGLPRTDRRAYAIVSMGRPWQLQDGLPPLEGRRLSVEVQGSMIHSFGFPIAGMRFGRNHQSP